MRLNKLQNLSTEDWSVTLPGGRLDAVLLEPVTAGYLREGRSYVTLAVGCTGGKHRSVAIAEEFARRLTAAEGIDLTLLTRRADGARWAEIAPGARTVAEVPDRRPERLVWEQRRAPQLARRIGVDLWHGPHYTMPLRLAVPSVVTVHDLTFFDHPEWHERTKVAFFRRMIRASVRRASGLIAVSDHTAAQLLWVEPWSLNET